MQHRKRKCCCPGGKTAWSTGIGWYTFTHVCGRRFDGRYHAKHMGNSPLRCTHLTSWDSMPCSCMAQSDFFEIESKSMKLTVTKISDPGVLEKERVVMKATADEQVGAYLIFKTKELGDNMVSNKPTKTFWFPDKEVKAGDYVVLYTKPGQDKSTQNEGGGSSHFFYWNLKEPLWPDKNYSAVLMHADKWVNKMPEFE
jgi:hypothetical protein